MQTITISHYQPEWEALYIKEAESLAAVFDDFSIIFHHIGSTAIPDCAAKSKIDILGVTHDILEVDAFNLDKLGYQALGEYGMKQRRFFQKRGDTEVNLHIFEDSDPEVARHLRFCDYLRNHPEKIEAYSQLKKELASRFSSDIDQYTLGKAEFVKKIDRKAALKDEGAFWDREIHPRKSIWSPEEILRAMETNMHLHMTYFSKYIPSMDLLFEPDVSVIHSPIPDDTFNYVIGAHFEKENLSARVSHILELYDEGKHPFSWWVGDSDTPNALKKELAAQGLSPKEEDVGMSLNLDQASLARRLPELTIKRALGKVELQHFATIFASIGGYPRYYEELLSQIPPVLYSDGAPLEMYVGYLEGVPVVTGILVLHANVGGIYFVMTHPDFRKRGLGTEMMISMLLRAKDRGYHLATLQASASGKSLYEKLGFQANSKFVEYTI